ncbi:hypothetical protein CKAN_01713800 [Cinnamomum micranthum f. kanehirae]|uniref:Uncharacterized protein n=1 Tax=Cinnamomum micranthum f. kanehirae TaxID=337451 RepID=A0A3S3NA56_9MAGN|nr:hypothetical protein CKAN_01713800 [Cinnamomum micranthum f. kanehirae]
MEELEAGERKRKGETWENAQIVSSFLVPVPMVSDDNLHLRRRQPDRSPPHSSSLPKGLCFFSLFSRSEAGLHLSLSISVTEEEQRK